jgi:DNA-binding IclR family transcriptional regulator
VIAGLDDRGAQVLRHVVEDYIETAEPVGSRTISKKMGQHLSPATIRNIMADLEEMGYLAQPHTSAGRPHRAGFRYYVDYLLELRKLARPERDQLQRMAGDAAFSSEELVRQVSRLVSTLARQAWVVVLTRLSSQPLRSLSLVPAGSDRILLVAVTQAGWVEHRLIEGERGLSGNDIQTINNYLSELSGPLPPAGAREDPAGDEEGKGAVRPADAAGAAAQRKGARRGEPHGSVRRGQGQHPGTAGVRGGRPETQTDPPGVRGEERHRPASRPGARRGRHPGLDRVGESGGGPPDISVVASGYRQGTRCSAASG